MEKVKKYPKFAQNLRQARRVAGLTQEELAGRVGRTIKAIGAWEEGRAIPSHEILLTMAKMFSIHVNEFYKDVLDAEAEAEAKSSHTLDPKQIEGVAPEPGLYHDIIRALIKAQDEISESSKAQRRISEALLEERQLMRDTAKATIDLMSQATNPLRTITANLEKLHEEVEIETKEQEALKVFVLKHIAKLSKTDIGDLADELDSVTQAGHIERNERKKAASGKLSKQ